MCHVYYIGLKEWNRGISHRHIALYCADNTMCDPQIIFQRLDILYVHVMYFCKVSCDPVFIQEARVIF